VRSTRSTPRNRLSAALARSAPIGKHCDGAGLWLYRLDEGSVGRWVLRVTVHGKRREMGLGTIQDVSLAEARDLADRWRKEARAGRNPIRVREAERREASRADILLSVVTQEAFEARKAELKGDGEAGRWLSPLTGHVLPKLGSIPVTEINQRDIHSALAPIWHEKADTARKALNRLSIVLRHAAAMGLDVDLAVTAKAKALLGKSRHQPKSIPAMPWQEVPAFYASLDAPTITHLALRLMILTGVRSGPLRAIRLEQIDGDVWTVPGEAMKGLKDKTPDFRVPLSGEALRVIELAKAHERGGFLFPNQSRKGCITDVALQQHMARRKLAARPHGFRTSLRVWLAEATDAPHEVAEGMLAHVADSAVVRAYRRTDYLEQRRALAERWADHVTGGTGKVLALVAAQ
jgi:integrase